ncbi:MULTISPECIES: DUF2075 domain-containing protein [unclassified Cyanobium]|uniref:DUF2075 domain-containing protein n=1 Tax=unclassified Cyanobium TaxID=2627006 RepID=UPI0020CD809C|nr:MULTISPECIES: DUF2075 domain-containing protein [unclassified Cyanobium]MCP9835472.1 DUF2075 domain-containing protein [Cyanobium sp. La Preciosa 7G6]MCP9938238.1 DUF2075 domain-containing protein [Cyanobium sp. Aljojuca 7A6]
MIIYLATREEFLQHVREQRIEEEVRRCYLERTGHKVAANEFRAWQNSLQCVGNVLQFEAIPKELGVAIEYRIHNTAKRIDLLLSGRNADGAPSAVIVELKQWETVEATELDGVVRTFLGKGPRETTHPSYQAMSYGALLRGFNTAVVEDNIALQPCAYLHNCTDGAGLSDGRYRDYLEQAPLFLRHDNAAMAAFLRRCLEVGDRGRTIERIRDGKAKPSRQLADAVGRMLKGNTEFVLIDEQKVVFEKALALARHLREGRHGVLLVQGGPGTGKSVVAVNLLARLMGMGLNARYVSKNAAPRAVYRAKLTGSLQKGDYDNLFCGSACFVACPEGFYDVLIVDESHRLMTKTIYDKEGENQVKEIIHASKLTVFFLDEDQRVTFDDIGSTAEIEKWSQYVEAELHREVLPSQFRCSGSDGYLAWLDSTLGIRATANERLDPGGYDIRVFDDPLRLHAAIRAANQANQARMVAGYCWNWASKLHPDAWDITIDPYGYRARWNLSKDGSVWIMKPGTVEEVGCIHTCQGLELETIGVIIGPDLVYRDGEVVTVPTARARTDQSLKGYKVGLRRDPQAIRLKADAIIRNTYRTLMSRGTKACWVFACDPELNLWLKRSTMSQL